MTLSHKMQVAILIVSVKAAYHIRNRKSYFASENVYGPNCQIITVAVKSVCMLLGHRVGILR